MFVDVLRIFSTTWRLSCDPGRFSELSIERTDAAVLHADDCEPVDLMAGRAVIVPAAITGYRLESTGRASVIRSQPPARRS